MTLEDDLRSISRQIDDWSANKIGLIDWGRNQVVIDRAAEQLETLRRERDAFEAEACAWANKSLDLVGGMRSALNAANAALRNAAAFVGNIGYEGAAGQLQAAADKVHEALYPHGLEGGWIAWMGTNKDVPPVHGEELVDVMVHGVGEVLSRPAFSWDWRGYPKGDGDAYIEAYRLTAGGNREQRAEIAENALYYIVGMDRAKFASEEPINVARSALARMYPPDPPTEAA
jgi:hypothetical protein